MKGYFKLKNKLTKGVADGKDNFNFSLHPLFFIFGIYYAICGRLLEFLVCTFSAIFHELGHAFVAVSNGYSLVNLSLMPYGATISGDFDGLRFKDEFAILLAGPLTSVSIAIFTTALWWFYPKAYPYTQVFFESNLAIGLINLLPAKPLDGGRILSACFNECFGKKGEWIFKVTGFSIALFLITAFVVVCFKAKTISDINFSLLFFASFIVVGSLGRSSRKTYQKVLSGLSQKALLRGVEVKRCAVVSETSIKRVVALLDKNKFNEVIVLDKNAVITQSDLDKRLFDCPIYATVGECCDYLLGKSDKIFSSN